MPLADRTVRDLIAAFRSSEPTPGGGSASALAGAVGAALIAMVSGLGRPRATSDADLERLAAAGRRAADVSDQLTTLIDRDSDAYNTVMAAYKLPRGSEDDKRARAERIQQALDGAIAAPLDVMRACARTLSDASLVAKLANANASSDVHVALELLAAGLRGAGANVEINLSGLRDGLRAAEVKAEVTRLMQKMEEDLAAARAQLSSSA